MTKKHHRSYHANGKLLISGEYLVLKGAKALAVPLKKGQALSAKNCTDHFLQWQAYTPEGLWLNLAFDQDLNIIDSNKKVEGEKLAHILKKSLDLNPDSKPLLANKFIKTQLEFNKNWGWGSSSTLIALISQYLDVNPYLLLKQTFGGSGYDIACAINQSPLIYQLVQNTPKVNLVPFDPSFKNQLFFVYSGQKQNSQHELRRFNKAASVNPDIIDRTNSITEQMLKADSLKHFGHLMNEHEELIGKTVHLNPVKNEHFSNFKGFIKSLGAWGGDFLMVASEEGRKYIVTYFKNKGIHTVFGFDEVVLSKNS